MSIRVIDKQPQPIRDWSQPVDEIRVDVKLFNAIDEGIARRGGMRDDEVQSCEVKALSNVSYRIQLTPINRSS